MVILSLENSCFKFCVQHQSSKFQKVSIWNLIHIYGIIIIDYYPRPITLVWILTELWPFLYLESSTLKFCVQHQSSKLLKVSIWNLTHVYEIIFDDCYPKPLALIWILTESLPFLYFETPFVGIHLKINTCLQNHNWRLLSNAHNTNIWNEFWLNYSLL